MLSIFSSSWCVRTAFPIRRLPELISILYVALHHHGVLGRVKFLFMRDNFAYTPPLPACQRAERLTWRQTRASFPIYAGGGRHGGDEKSAAYSAILDAFYHT